MRLPAALGRSGIGTGKREGDGVTPLGTMALLSAWRRPGRMPGLRSGLPLRLARDCDGWCDAPDHPAYNRPVRLPHPASAETMRRSDRLYDFVVVLDWNLRRRARGRGSAIFLHIAKEGYQPTAGCVALSPADMRRLAPFLKRGTRLRVLG
ncbi:hypothetical protein GCM10011390_29110 [Aureimonas endophytica]|uniref:L,D-TPase catalytic domain-containing protein n=1 Tax=Aureimonas endophytica TaxID=2027858 RepID=A0A916ZPQ6_9HYPH|nr:hypothetical protein GCM10011390_29110 [Aureimonas endophytica]